MNKVMKLGLVLLPILTACDNAKNIKEKGVLVNNPAEGGAMTQWVSVPVPDAESQWRVKGVPSEWRNTPEGGKALFAAINVTPGASEYYPLTRISAGQPVEDFAHAELSIRTGGEWNGTVYEAQEFSFETVEHFVAPEQLTDHSYYLRYEGPGWESDKVGYRLYFDWRNAIDVFVKTGSDPVLSKVGQDGYDSYHSLSEWGGDALKVGKSLGVGALGRKTDDGILHFQYVDNTSYTLLENSQTSASFKVNYENWALDENGSAGVDIQTVYRINAFDPTTHINVKASEAASGIVAGLVAHDNTQVIDVKGAEWGVIGTWGPQSVLGDQDKLGLAVFYRLDQVVGVEKGEFDHLVMFKPLTAFEYKILAVWPQRDEAIHSAEAFSTLLEDKLNAFENPISVQVVEK